MSRQAPPRKQAPRSTPSRVKPADSRAFCSAMLALSVLASIRFTCVWANSYSASRRWASLPKPLPRSAARSAMPMFQQGSQGPGTPAATAPHRQNGRPPRQRPGARPGRRRSPAPTTAYAADRGCGSRRNRSPCLRRILVEALQKIEVGFDDGAQAHGLGHGATVATAAARPDSRPRRHSASAPAVCVRPRRMTQSPGLDIPADRRRRGDPSSRVECRCRGGRPSVRHRRGRRDRGPVRPPWSRSDAKSSVQWGVTRTVAP